MKYIFRSAVFILVAVSMLLSCEDDPTSIGVTILPGGDIPKIDSFKTTVNSSFFYEDSINLGPSSRVFLGKFDNIEEVSFLVRYSFFELPAELKDDVLADSINVIDAWIGLKPDYLLGDNNAELDFTVHRINSFWTSTDFDEDSLALLDYDESIDISFDKQLSDSLIKFKLDLDVTYGWLRRFFDVTQPDNFGVYFKPTVSTSRILGIEMIDDLNLRDSVFTVIIEKPGSYIDTLIASTLISVHVVKGSIPEEEEGIVYLQGGFPVRSGMVFDVDSLPDRSIINSAILEVVFDSTKSVLGSVSSNVINVAFLSDSTEKEINTSFGSYALNRSGNIYKGDIKEIVQGWIDNFDNQGIRLSLSDEERTLSKIALVSHTNNNLGLRPKLTILYTTK